MDAVLTVTLALLVAFRLSAAIFLHEPSFVPIHPLVHENHSDFGFAMGFQTNNRTLVVGAPSVDLMGKVYSCDMDHLDDMKDVACEEKTTHFNHQAWRKKRAKEQHFYTGASIAATSEFFLTCAPLLTSRDGSDAIGKCFVFDQNNTTKLSKTTYDRYLQQKFTQGNKVKNRHFSGGVGWSTYADEEIGVMLIFKSSLAGDILYTPINQPTGYSKSLVIDVEIPFVLETFFNIGFGVTSGKFFSNETVFAFSMETDTMGGVIEFLKYDSKTKILSVLNARIAQKKFTIQSKVVGSMFGSALATADMNTDGWADLVVAAPAFTEVDCVECGAVYIFLGGDMKTIGEKKKLQITGSKEFSRFSTAIAVKDLDGDSKPELVIGAPYEDNGLGAVYILSGQEMYQKLELPENVQLQLSELKHTQKIQMKTFRTLGFSLQIVPDADDNGCSELVAGSPGNGTALLFKCIQTINVTLSSALIGKQIVREQDQNFTINVCAAVNYPNPPRDIYAILKVNNTIIGDGTQLLNSEFELNISCHNCITNRVCENVTVMLNDTEEGDYTFKSQAKLRTDHMFNSTAFNKTWAVTNQYSQLYKRLEVPRHCTGDDCMPRLSMKFYWSKSKEEPYNLGSTNAEAVTIIVNNTGHSSYKGCVWVRVNGALVSRVDCATYNKGYRCYLPKPLKRDTGYAIILPLNMTKPTNVDTKLLVEALLYEDCNTETVIDAAIMPIPYIISTEGIRVKSMSHSRNITDKQILEPNFSILDDHEYLVTNNGSIFWKKVIAMIFMKKKPFIADFKVSTEKMDCIDFHTADVFNYTCYLDIMPNSTQRITTTTEILKSNIRNNLVNGKLNMTSEIHLYLVPTEDIKIINATTIMRFEKELTVGNNKLLIILAATFVALLILIVIITILYKFGFFKRKQKQRLHVLRESIKQRNSRRNTHVSSAADAQEGIEDLQMDVDDDPFDGPFENIPIPPPTYNGAILIEEKAQVHC